MSTQLKAFQLNNFPTTPKSYLDVVFGILYQCQLELLDSYLEPPFENNVFGSVTPNQKKCVDLPIPYFHFIFRICLTRIYIYCFVPRDESLIFQALTLVINLYTV